MAKKKMKYESMVLLSKSEIHFWTKLGSTGTERLVRLNTSEGHVNLLCVYAPTLSAPADINDDFDSFIKEFNKQEDLIILGDLNAHVGSDSEAWPNCIGHFGIGNRKMQ